MASNAKRRQLAVYARLVLVLVVAQLGYYNRRDLFSHWIRKDQPARRPCTHACCRGLRPHPEGYPVTKRNAYLWYSSDKELLAYSKRHQRDTPEDQRVTDQVLAEMQRRDMMQDRREARKERKRQKWAASRAFRHAERERFYNEAETATTGYMLNRRGREAGINPRSLFTGPESRVRKYGSEELLEYFERHGRPTEAYFEGRDTRLGRGYQFGARRRITSEEAYWRDQFERAKWEIESPVHEAA